MIARTINQPILEAATQMPVVSLTGPRQSGKTTLVQSVFSDYKYVSLEDPVTRLFAIEDAKGFLESYGHHLIIDEVQYAPKLFSYIQLYVDEKRENGLFILTGSQHFLLLEKITQSLAGRVAIFHLLPFSLDEIKKFPEQAINLEQLIFKGSYPRLYDQGTLPKVFHPAYIQTYLERDVRQISNIGDLTSFQAFMKLCASSTGQLLNMNRMATDLGVSMPTVKRWLSVLEASFIIFLLPPYFRNFRKRIVKSKKLYFLDTGLACFLLNIKSPDQITFHYAKGALFENWVICELLKLQYNRGNQPELYFWQDKTGHELDVLMDINGQLKAMEIKSAKTLRADFFQNFTYFQKVSNIPREDCFLLYGGTENQVRQSGQVVSWDKLSELFSEGS